VARGFGYVTGVVARTFEISARSRRLLGELARTSGVSMSEVLDAALESYRRHMFVQRANADLAHSGLIQMSLKRSLSSS